MLFWHGSIPEEKIIHHVNGNKSDNRKENLEFSTHSDNKKHASSEFGTWCGERNGMAKLTEQNVRTIRELNENKIPHKEIANTFNIAIGHVSDIIHFRAWKHVI
jgi:hypothetical protein